MKHFRKDGTIMLPVDYQVGTITRRTWEKAGIRTTAINQLVAELTASWVTADGVKLVKILAEDVIPTFGKFK